MNARPLLLVGIAIAALALIVAVESHRLSSARSGVEAAAARLRTAQNDVQEITLLRSRQARIAEHKRPEQDVIARIHAAMAEAGLPVATHFKSLRPESDAAAAGAPQYRRQSVAVALQSMDLPGLGRFLAAWKYANPLWTPTRLELVHAQAKGAEGLYDVSITFSAIYLAGPASTSPPTQS